MHIFVSTGRRMNLIRNPSFPFSSSCTDDCKLSQNEPYWKERHSSSLSYWTEIRPKWGILFRWHFILIQSYQLAGGTLQKARGSTKSIYPLRTFNTWIKFQDTPSRSMIWSVRSSYHPKWLSAHRRRTSAGTSMKRSTNMFGKNVVLWRQVEGVLNKTLGEVTCNSQGKKHPIR